MSATGRPDRARTAARSPGLRWLTTPVALTKKTAGLKIDLVFTDASAFPEGESEPDSGADIDPKRILHTRQRCGWLLEHEHP